MVGAFPLMLNAAPESVISQLIDQAFVPPGLFGHWRLGHGSASLLGSGTTLPDAATGKALAAGQSEFPWVGDTWRGAVSVAQAIREVCESEGGQFYLAADGTPTFEDRHARPKRITPSASISGALSGVQMQRVVDRVANEISVTVHPREVSTSTEVLWQSETAIRLAGSTPREVMCRYRDPDQQVAWIGASSVITPVRGIDFTVTDKLDGSGTDYTAQVEVLCEVGASSARLRIRRTSVSPPVLYVHAMRIRGTPLRAFVPVIAAQRDGASVLAYGHRPLALDMPLQDDIGAAQDMATALLATHKAAHTWLTVEIDTAASASMLTHAISRDVGDRIDLTDAGLALNSAPCFIDGIRHEITRGGPKDGKRGDHHRVTWRTSPAGLQAYFVLNAAGIGTLGSAALGY